MSMKKAVMFDLDGTLCPMDQDIFLKTYFSEIVKVTNYDPKRMIDGLYKGTMAVLKNDGSCLNRELFWKVFYSINGDMIKETAEELTAVFENFYRTAFHDVRKVITETETPRKIIDALKEKGIRTILATSPVFPEVAVESRLSWIGLKLEDFEYVTSYDNMKHTKPNPYYYTDILEEIQLDPSEVVMVGNNVDEDIKPALALGIDAILVTDFLMGNPDEVDVLKCRLDDLLENINKLL